jgi:hypothetical protein
MLDQNKFQPFYAQFILKKILEKLRTMLLSSVPVVKKCVYSTLRNICCIPSSGCEIPDELRTIPAMHQLTKAGADGHSIPQAILHRSPSLGGFSSCPAILSFCNVELPDEMQWQDVASILSLSPMERCSALTSHHRSRKGNVAC